MESIENGQVVDEINFCMREIKQHVNSSHIHFHTTMIIKTATRTQHTNSHSELLHSNKQQIEIDECDVLRWIFNCPSNKYIAHYSIHPSNRKTSISDYGCDWPKNTLYILFYLVVFFRHQRHTCVKYTQSSWSNASLIRTAFRMNIIYRCLLKWDLDCIIIKLYSIFVMYGRCICRSIFTYMWNIKYGLFGLSSIVH